METDFSEYGGLRSPRLPGKKIRDGSMRGESTLGGVLTSHGCINSNACEIYIEEERPSLAEFRGVSPLLLDSIAFGLWGHSPSQHVAEELLISWWLESTRGRWEGSGF